MTRTGLYIGPLLASFAILGSSAPALACAYSRPIVTARPVETNQNHLAQVRVRVQRTLVGRRLFAARATVLADMGIFHRGDRIVILLPRDESVSCYHGGLADPEAVAAYGSLEGYVVLVKRESSGAYSAWLVSEEDRFRYDEFAHGRMRGEWRRARFRSGDD
jgi:hypothetical protein